ncbi:hypothetical protein ANO11243_022260 [Dothideomycetidae sp. 11243]|nr:hypothetical protein ANO11243_022260 [fungal sp. No.11243]
MFSILNEIEDTSTKSTTSVVTASVGTSASIYLLVAVTGYLTFGDHVVGNIVSQYIPSVSSTIGKAAIVVLVIFSYPLQVHPCRASLDAVLKWRPVSVSRSSSPVIGSPSRNSLLGHSGGAAARRTEMSETRFAALTTVIIVFSYIVAMTVSSLERVLAYVGSTGSTSISFILPGLFYYKISSPDSPLHQKLMKEDDDQDDYESDDDSGHLRAGSWVGKWKSRNYQRMMLRRASLGLAIYGACVMVTCLITNTYFIAGH